jgi:hypothetical protein
MIAKTGRWVRRLSARLPFDAKALTIRAALANTVSGAKIAARKPILRVAVQSLEDPFYFGLFGAICQQLKTLTGAYIELAIQRSISGAVGNNWEQRLARSSIIGWLISSQWVRASRIFSNSVGYRSLSLANPVRDCVDWFRSREIWRREFAGANIGEVRILGVQTGDLIIDTYLRFRPSAHFDNNDPFVLRLIRQAHRDVRRARSYFRRRRPALYVTSYSTYIEHGIAVRVALQEGIPVRSFGSLLQFGKELTTLDWFHTPNTSGYRELFQSLSDQEGKIAQAEEQLKSRLDGNVDSATSYMRVSAYAATSQPVPDVFGAVIIFLHDFYDSPHIYDGLLFPDFWTWVCFTIDTLVEAGQKYFLKPHPNQAAPSGGVLAQLAEKYFGLPVLSTKITNSQLAEAGILCGVTVYGTVAHELAYLGVPTIACAKHPHHSFDFCRRARTIDQYRKFLMTPQECILSKEQMRRQSLAFYYMHNLQLDREAQLLRIAYIEFWKGCNDPGIGRNALIMAFDRMRNLPGFQASIAGIAAELGSSTTRNNLGHVSRAVTE